MIVISLIILFFPFKDGSTIEIIIEEFYSKQWNSKTITQLIISFIAWIIVIWKMALVIMETILYKKRKNLFQKELSEKGELDIFQKRSGIFQIFKKDAPEFVDYTLKLLINSFIETAQPLSANATLLIRDILESAELKRKEKIEKIREIVEKEGHKVNDPKIVKAFREI
ncbi:hypothetical protein HLA87_02505 [Mycoplasma miroungigenitalium]|uniref:Uncharacterized protein n=1 Tax=Mycoplasma miroungigenitalium TaxID=754515 RepID=A0A6M4JB84_9MOLU|nr:hypothetical protein [Mycoplasma miroungigenitalium]QJR43645.1 hypothetical protein HLA87_02505 [Mycoplasma miroungigenitalium]